MPVRKSKGFTLIELLVVIAIIGILATFIVASFTSAQQKARDSQRKTNLDAVKKALSLVKSDCVGGAYPFASNFSGVSATAAFNGLITYFNDPDLKYMNNTVVNTDPTFTYKYGSELAVNSVSSVIASSCPNATPGGANTSASPNFRLWVLLENANDPSAVATHTKCTPPTGPGLIQYTAGTPTSWTSGVTTGVNYVVCND